MKLEIMERQSNTGSYLTLVNTVTRKYVAQLGPHDNYFNAQRIIEATDLYNTLLEMGLLKQVLAVVDRKQHEQEIDAT